MARDLSEQAFDKVRRQAPRPNRINHNYCTLSGRPHLLCQLVDLPKKLQELSERCRASGDFSIASPELAGHRRALDDALAGLPSTRERCDDADNLRRERVKNRARCDLTPCAVHTCATVAAFQAELRGLRAFQCASFAGVFLLRARHDLKLDPTADAFLPSRGPSPRPRQDAQRCPPVRILIAVAIALAAAPPGSITISLRLTMFCGV